MTEYALAYSPCPNDTYVFAALTNGLLGDDVPLVRVSLADVETLNDAAERGTYELTKISYGALPRLGSRYRVLRSGGALGYGCGPLLVSKPGALRAAEDLAGKRVAIPGLRTTAFLLLRLALRDGTPFEPVVMPFDTILAAVADERVDAGLLIHEARFTYSSHGLAALLDVGEWWDERTKLPVPLGAILVRADVGDSQAHAVDAAIRKSLAYARRNEPDIMPYVRAHATEMDDDVMRRHIAAYVNEYTDDVGERGVAAVSELFARARAAGIVTEAAEPQFV